MIAHISRAVGRAAVVARTQCRVTTHLGRVTGPEITAGRLFLRGMSSQQPPQKPPVGIAKPSVSTEANAQQPNQPQTPKLPALVEVTEQNMMALLQASQSQPIILYCTADWCGPCKELSPKLEAGAASIGVTLAKMDIDRCQNIAAQLQVQAVPTLFILHGGKIQKGMQGGDPSQLKTFLDAVAKLGGIQSPEDKLADADLMMADGDITSAVRIYSDVVKGAGENRNLFAQASAGLIQCALKEGNLDAAQSLANNLRETCPNQLSIASVSSALANVDFAGKKNANISPLEEKVKADPNDFEARYALAEGLFANGNAEEAIGHAIEIVKRDRSWNDDAGRTLAIKFIDALGAESEIAAKGRKRLSAVLFI